MAGHYIGKNAGHGFIGTVAGGLLANFVEDMVKGKGKQGKHGKHGKHGSSHGGSSWGGKW